MFFGQRGVVTRLGFFREGVTGAWCSKRAAELLAHAKTGQPKQPYLHLGMWRRRNQGYGRTTVVVTVGRARPLRMYKRGAEGPPKKWGGDGRVYTF